MRIALKADGGAKVGFGHLGRCAALAQAFAALGERPVFVDVPAECREWLKGLGLRSGVLGRARWDVLVADSYRLTPAQFRSLRRRARTLLVIDDLGDHAGACDWVLNGHVDAAKLSFQAVAGGLLLGPKFVPLRREYWRAAEPKAVSGRIKRLLVSLGGAPDRALIESVLKAAADALPDAEICAVGLGPEGRNGRVVRHGRLASLRPLFERCDAAISAGGQTLYEAAFTGTPVVAIELVANQAGNVRGMSAAGAALDAGRPGRDFASGLVRRLRRLDRERALRARMSAAGRRLVDGLGAPRVAALLVKGGGR